MDMRYHELVDFSETADQLSLEVKLVAFARSLGFDLVSAAIADRDRSGEGSTFKQLGNTPPAFIDKYLSVEDARRDPVMRRLKTTTVPFAYDQSMYVACGAGDVWETQAEFGYKTGLALAQHLPYGRCFLFGVDRDQTLPGNAGMFIQTMANVQLLAAFCLDAALRCLDPQKPIGAAVVLTYRESEVLKWTLEGKSSWVVGSIVGISASTVNFHLRNAMVKFGVSSKHVAAAKAASMGLI